MFGRVTKDSDRVKEFHLDAIMKVLGSGDKLNYQKFYYYFYEYANKNEMTSAKTDPFS